MSEQPAPVDFRDLSLGFVLGALALTLLLYASGTIPRSEPVSESVASAPPPALPLARPLPAREQRDMWSLNVYLSSEHHRLGVSLHSLDTCGDISVYPAACCRAAIQHDDLRLFSSEYDVCGRFETHLRGIYRNSVLWEEGYPISSSFQLTHFGNELADEFEHGSFEPMRYRSITADYIRY